jgi:general stress protein YciG
MSGTKEGARKAAEKNLARDPDWYRKIGARGGQNGHTGGFASYARCSCAVVKGRHYTQQCAGKIGGTISRRTKVQA